MPETKRNLRHPPSSPGVRRLLQFKESGAPIKLSVNGVEFPVLDDSSFEKLVDLVDRLDRLQAIRDGLQEIDAGKVITLEQLRNPCGTSMAYRIEMALRAQLHINETREYIARESPARAAKWYRGLLNKLKTLKTRPFSCPKAPESETFGEELRELLYGKRRNVYRILFTVRDDTVRVAAFWHSSRGESPF